MGASCRSRGVGVVAVLAVFPVALGAERIATPTLRRVEVLLRTAPTLPDASRTSMMQEAAAIWREQGVLLEWLPPDTVRPISVNRIRVLVVSKRFSASPRHESITMGELIRPRNAHPLALISIDSAQQLISSVRGRTGYELIAIDHRRLGVVLGRALAHEIGHYLLDTVTHARSGLMRSNFNALEFTDLRTGTFSLDDDAAAWLRTPTAQQFAYASH